MKEIVLIMAAALKKLKLQIMIFLAAFRKVRIFEFY